MADAMSDFTEMDAGQEPTPKKEEKPSVTPPEKPAEKPPEKPVEEPEQKAQDKPAEVKPEEEKRPTRMRELGEAYDQLKKRVRTEFEPKIQSLTAKVKELEERKPDEGPVLAKLQAYEKRNAELEQQMAFIDYSQSSEFKSKWEQPFNEAWYEALGDFEQMKVRFQDGVDDMGEPKFSTRPATAKDLQMLASMDLSDMDDAATKMFGASAARAIAHIQNVSKLYKAKEKALKEAQSKSSEWMKQRELNARLSAENANKVWGEINKSLQERFPKAYAVDADNPDDKTAHAKGFALADLLFLGSDGLTPEQVEALPQAFRDTVKAKKPLTEGQKVQLHAIARLKMANHDRKVVALKKANARIAELEKELSEFEKSEPKGGKAGTSDVTAQYSSPEEQVEAEIRAMDK